MAANAKGIASGGSSSRPRGGVIVVTSADMKDKREVVNRVHAALVLRGYAGPAPAFNIMWTRWFESSAA